MDTPQQYPAAEVERMMKLQDVLLKAMAKKISWVAAAEIIGVTPRTVRRWRKRLEEHGYSGLADRRKGRPSDRRVPLATVEEVLRLYREKYFDLNIRHFHEKLGEEHGIQLSYTRVQKALQGAGLVARGRKRSFGTWQGRLPQELRLEGITPLEQANRFLNERYIAEFNEKVTLSTRTGIPAGE